MIMKNIKLCCFMIKDLLKPESYLDWIFRFAGVYVIYSALTGGFVEIRLAKGSLLAVGIFMILSKWKININWIRKVKNDKEKI